MRVHETFLNSAIFLCQDVTEPSPTRSPVATGFIVALPDGPIHGHWIYIVTARHCIEHSREPLILRINKEDDTFEDIITRKDDWFSHDSADVAAFLLVPPERMTGTLRLSATRIEQFITQRAYRSRDLGVDGIPVEVGHQVFFTGLFAKLPGRQRNLPIARFGRISQMPAEPITLIRAKGTTRFESLAYLIEAQSWGGHSGSPAFWTHPMYIYAKGAPSRIGFEGSFIIPRDIIGLLGLVSAHYDIPTRAEVTGDILGEIRTPLNSGLAVVTPADHIVELLHRDDVTEDRECRR